MTDFRTTDRLDFFGPSCLGSQESSVSFMLSFFLLVKTDPAYQQNADVLGIANIIITMVRVIIRVPVGVLSGDVLDAVRGIRFLQRSEIHNSK